MDHLRDRSYRTIRTYHNTVDGQRNVVTTGNEDNDCSLWIVFITGGTAGSGSPLARLEFSNAKVYGLVKITDFRHRPWSAAR
jgi:hypothetical protein